MRKFLFIFLVLNILLKYIENQSTVSYVIVDSEVIIDNEQELNLDAKWIDKNEFLDLLNYLNKQSKSVSLSSLIIDTRNSNEYNGWKPFKNVYFNLNQTGLLPLYDIKNGRVYNSHNFDADWLSLFEPNTLNSLVQERLGLRPKIANVQTQSQVLPVLLYDTDKKRLEKVKNYLVENFQINLIYLCQLEMDDITKFIQSANQTELFFQEPFYDMLLSPEILYTILRPNNDSHVVNVKPITSYKLFECSKEGPEAYYQQSHIPTAVHLNTNELEDPIKSVRKNRTELAKVFLKYGILTNNTEMIILYGNPDPMASFRVALLMKWMGIRDVHVLNGGFRSWLIKDLPAESYSNKPIPIKTDLEEHVKLFEEQSYYAQSPINYIVDQNYVSDLVKNHDIFQEQYVLVDVRTYEEHTGEVSGYKNVKQKGRIPTSVWGKAGSESDQLEDYRNPDLTMRSGVEILSMWDELGIDYKLKNIIFYCGNGWRGSEVMFYAELMGLYKISLYDGGWVDWSSNLNNSILTGTKEENENMDKYETILVTEITSSTSATTKTSTISTTTLQTSTSTTSHSTTASTSTTTTTSTTNQITTATTSSKKLNKTETSTKSKTSLSPSDIFFKNQFESVTANPNNSNSIKLSKYLVFFIFLFLNLGLY